jgi:hypothetical protein
MDTEINELPEKLHSVTKGVSLYIGGDMIQTFTEQSDLY